MTRGELIKLLEEIGAVRQGHFELSSGRHSGTYIQCALVLQYPNHAEALGRAIAEKFQRPRTPHASFRPRWAG